MTAIASGSGLLTMLSTEGTARPAGDSADVDLTETGQQDSFMALLQQAAAVLPQALQAIRSELPGDSCGVDGQSGEGAADVQPDVLLAQLGAVFISQGNPQVLGGAVNVSEHQGVILAAGASSVSAAKLDVMSEMAAGSPVESAPLTADASGFTVGSPSVSGPSADTAAPVSSPHRPVQAPVGSQGWAEEIGARLTMLGARGEQTASLRLSPEHLGPLEVRITIQDDKASVWFGAMHAQTREAIEQALPRLREMLQSQGLELSDAGVFDESSSRDAPERHSGNRAAEPDSSDVALQPLRHPGLLDLYV